MNKCLCLMCKVKQVSYEFFFVRKLTTALEK